VIDRTGCHFCYFGCSVCTGGDLFDCLKCEDNFILIKGGCFRLTNSEDYEVYNDADDDSSDDSSSTTDIADAAEKPENIAWMSVVLGLCVIIVVATCICVCWWNHIGATGLLKSDQDKGSVN
jgi:hypothetical protein